jgi:hypothetical protein
MAMLDAMQCIATTTGSRKREHELHGTSVTTSLLVQISAAVNIWIGILDPNIDWAQGKANNDALSWLGNTKYHGSRAPCIMHKSKFHLRQNLHDNFKVLLFLPSLLVQSWAS